MQSGTVDTKLGIKHSDANTGASDAANITRSLVSVGGRQMEHIECILGRDCVDSFRTCMRRYGKFRTVGSDSANRQVREFKYYQTDASVGPANHPDGTMIKYVSSCYHGFRGGIRVRTYPLSRHSYAYVRNNENITRQWGQTNFRTFISRKYSGFDYHQVRTSPFADELDWDEMWTGAQLSTKEMSEITSIEIPYYHFNRFSSATEDQRLLCVQLVVLEEPVGFEGSSYVKDYVTTAIADDFGLFFFLGVAPMWRKDN